MKLYIDRYVLASCVALIGFIEVFYVFFPARLPIPQETHFFVSLLTKIQNSTDTSSAFYGLLLTPAYYLFDSFFQNPYLFVLLSYFTHFTFSRKIPDGIK